MASTYGVNTLWQKILDEKRRKTHLERLQQIQTRKPNSPGCIDNKPPPTTIKDSFDAKGSLLKEQKDYTLRKEARALQERIAQIKAAPSKYTDEDYWPINKIETMREILMKHHRVERDKKFYSNLKHIAPYYHVNKWEDDYKRQKGLQKFMRRVNYNRLPDFVDPWLKKKDTTLTYKTSRPYTTQGESGQTDEDWLVHFLSADSSTSPGHVGNIRKVKDARGKSRQRPHTADVAMPPPSSSISKEEGSEITLQTMASLTIFDDMENVPPTASISTLGATATLAEGNSTTSISVQSINKGICEENSSEGYPHRSRRKSVCSSSGVAGVGDTELAPIVSRSAAVRRSRFLDSESMLPIQTLPTTAASTPTAVASTPKKRSNSFMKSNASEKIDLISIQKLIRVVDQNMISPRAAAEFDSNKRNGDESVRSMGDGEFFIPAEISCFMYHGDPVLVLMVVSYEEREERGYDSSERDMSDPGGKGRILFETECEVNLKDLSDAGLLSVSRSESDEAYIQDVLLRVARKHGGFRGRDLELLQRIGNDLTSAVELLVSKGDLLLDARLVLNVLKDERDSTAATHRSAHAIDPTRQDHTFLPDKNRTLIQCGARIPLVILGAVGKTSFSEKVDSSPLEYAADFKAPSESLYCLIKIITTSDDQLLVKVHTIQQSHFQRGRNSKRPAVESGITLSQQFVLPTIILSALVEDSFANKNGDKELEQQQQQEHREMIVSFARNVQQNIQIEHLWRNGKNVLGLQNRLI